MPQDFYKILGIGYNANRKAIQKAFHKLAKELHPDRNPQNKSAEEKFKLVSEAYKTLSHPVKKSQYDLKLRYGYVPPVKSKPARPYTRARMYRRPKTFSRRAHILGGFSIVMIVIVVLFASFFLIRYNSQYNFHRGLSNYQNQRFSAAYFNFKQSLSPLNPYEAAAHLLMADICYHQQRNLPMASDHIVKAFAENPSDSIQGRLYYLQGQINQKTGHYPEAYQLFEQSLAFIPTLDSARYQLGEMDSFIFDRYQKAVEHYQILSDHNPSYFDAYMGLAYCHLKLENYLLVIKSIDTGLALRQDVAMAHYLKALAAQSLEDVGLACTSYSQASDLGFQAAKDSLYTYCTSVEGFTLPEPAAGGS